MQFPLVIKDDPIPIVSPDPHCADMFKLTFNFPRGTKTTIRIGFNDFQTGADLIFTNITTLRRDGDQLVPAVSQGYGARAVKAILKAARAAHMRNLCATQVSGEKAEKFWMDKIGFIPTRNHTNDFIWPDCQ